MKRLWLIRHGPTHASTLTGWTDLPADLGDSAALARLADALPEVPVVSSDLLRAVTTADAIAGRRLRLPHDAGLREMHFGRWEGLTAAEVAARDPGLSRAFWTDPAAAEPPDGEGWQALTTRVHASVDRLLGLHDELIIVAHFGPILALAQRATGESAAEVMGRSVAPLSLGEITITSAGTGKGTGTGWTLRRLNIAA